MGNPFSLWLPHLILVGKLIYQTSLTFREISIPASNSHQFPRLPVLFIYETPCQLSIPDMMFYDEENKATIFTVGCIPYIEYLHIYCPSSVL